MRTRRAQCLGLRRGPLDSHTQPPRTVAPKLIGRSGIDFSYGHWARRSCSPRTHVGRVRCARAARRPSHGRMRSCNFSSRLLGFQGNPSHHSLTLRVYPSDNVAPVLVRLSGYVVGGDPYPAQDEPVHAPAAPTPAAPAPAPAAPAAAAPAAPAPASARPSASPAGAKRPRDDGGAGGPGAGSG